MSNTDLQPDLEEVLQSENHPMGEDRPTAVAVVGPVRIQTLPEKAGTTKTVQIPYTAPPGLNRPVQVAQGNHRRARLVLMAIGGPMRIAFNKGSKEDPSTMALWPANVPFVHLGDDEVYVMAETNAITCSVVTGRWAVGEDGGS